MTDQVQQAILDAASYLARNQVGGGTAAGSPRASSTDVVDTALESLLGASPDTPREFQALLDRAFTTVEVDGHTETRYRRPSTAGRMMLSGGGVLTGAQASIVSRAIHARDEIFENLDPLVPLALTPDPDAVRDIRSLIHTVVEAVVEELSRPGGPTVIRVDRLLAELAGEDAIATPPDVTPEHFGGLLARLAEVFGMDRVEISSLDDERTFTSFVCIVGAVSSLCSSWATDRGFLDPLSGEPYLGTQLVQIERALTVVGQAVEEARRALDRAEVEPTERELPRSVVLPSGQIITTSIGAVLAWAEEYARRGHDRLRYGGQDGIGSFVTEATELAALVKALGTGIERQDGLSGVGSQPVLDSLEALHDCIEQSRDLAARLQREEPVTLVEAVVYLAGRTNSTPSLRPGLVLSLYGSGFNESTAVRLIGRDKDAPIVWRHLVSDSQIDIALDFDLSIVRAQVRNGGGEPAELDLTALRMPTPPDPSPAPPGAVPRPPLTLTDVSVDPSEFAAARATGAHAQPQARLTLRGSGFGLDSRVEVTTTDGRVHTPTEQRLVSDARLEVAIHTADEVAVVRVTNADHTTAQFGSGSAPVTNRAVPLSLRRARIVRSEVATLDPADPTSNVVTVRPGLSVTLFGSGFDDKTDVQLWSAERQLLPDHLAALSEGVLEVTVDHDDRRRIDRIVVAQPDGRRDELVIRWPGSDDPDQGQPKATPPEPEPGPGPDHRQLGAPAAPARAQKAAAPKPTDKKGK